jgi:hypothetical protein
MLAVLLLGTSAQKIARADSPVVASIYMDAPYVQGSYASNSDSEATNVSTETFEYSRGYCPETLAVGTIYPAGACHVETLDPYFGGATTTSSDPYDLGSHSAYASDHAPFTVTFSTPKQYVGFWWSAGNAANQVSFLNEDGIVLAKLDATDLYSAVTGPSLMSGNGDSYNPSDYFGHPGDYLDPTTVPPTRYAADEPFVYIHAFAKNGQSFKSIQIAGQGFEFDNLTTADTAPYVDGRLVFVTDIYPPQELTRILPNPNPTTRAGYDFAGWYSDPALNNYIGYSGDLYYPSSLSDPIYPYWSPKWINIIYTDPQSEFTCYVGDYFEQTRTILDSAGLSNPEVCGGAPTKQDLNLSGWNTMEDGSGQSYSFGDHYLGADDLTLYPVWTTSAPQSVSGSLLWSLSVGGVSTSFTEDKYSTQSILNLSRSFETSITVTDTGTAYLLTSPLSGSGSCEEWTNTGIALSQNSNSFSFSVRNSGTIGESSLVRGHCYKWSEDSSITNSGNYIGPVALDNATGTNIDFDQASLTSGVLKLPALVSATWPKVLPVDPRLDHLEFPTLGSIQGSSSSIRVCIMQGRAEDWSQTANNRNGNLNQIGTRSGTILGFGTSGANPLGLYSQEMSSSSFSESIHQIRATTSDTQKFITDSFILVRTLPSYAGAPWRCEVDPDHPFEIQPIAGEAAIIKISPYGLTRTLHLPTIDLGHHR